MKIQTFGTGELTFTVDTHKQPSGQWAKRNHHHDHVEHAERLGDVVLQMPFMISNEGIYLEKQP